MRHLVAAGSTPGRSHILAGRPNQDAFCVLPVRDGAVAVVCDGCGSEPKSGVGAELGASLAARAAARQLETGGRLDLGMLRAEVLSGLSLIADVSGLGAQESLLFTIVGAALSNGGAMVFACGDGVFAVDATVRRLGPFPDNAPPYLAYALAGADVGFGLLYEGPAHSVLVGTDGAADAELAPFWSEERCLSNPDAIRRRLKLMRLADDATVALIIRREP